MIDYPSPIYTNLIFLFRSTLRNLGKPWIRHNFREGNKVAHMLATEGSKRATINDMGFLMDPPWILNILQYDSMRGTSIKKCTILTCNSLAKLGNLNILFTNVLAQHRALAENALSNTQHVVATSYEFVFQEVASNVNVIA